ncbi:ATP synthase subunit g, mitochondrial [Lunasporangiospora selenospora]|uniref:ATP synthase subunit g, mitochondrial n=1 Tax=Lunasporangiospora selenospora TaxID=979761 RepID=A0A9P6KGX0_9FUNG|nr:ATP synthase subunit g, mitochondrial [Lunasporangiospora selenospora]
MNNVNKILSSTAAAVTKLSGPVVYNAKVAGQVAKQVYIREGMAPPTGAQFEAAKESTLKFVKSARSASTWKNISKEQYIGAGLVAAEAYAFFLVGEIIGRRNIVGYGVESADSHDAHH